MSTSRKLMTRRRRSIGKRRKGAAAVEFAIVAPLFFLLVIGCIEFGRSLMVQQVLTNASRVGARRAVTLTSNEADVISTTTNYASSASVPGITVAVNPNPATAKAGDEVTVTVSVPYSTISWIPAPWFMGGATLSANSVMRKEGFE